MSLVERTIATAERTPLPDFFIRTGVNYLVGRMKRQLAHSPSDASLKFAADMAAYPIALSTDEANDQHYEIPARFFDLTLGARRKYSCAYYEHGCASLDEAEETALAMTCAHAKLEDGQTILELGCGWGSMTLWMAEKYPAARITAVSNSNSQRAHIMEQAAARGFDNVNVITADMNDFSTDARFDRIVSVEMFEHMANWNSLLSRSVNWLKPDGRIFVHVFSHRATPYRFDHTDKTDWIAQHFFTGGIMPSHALMRSFPEIIEVEEEARWSGSHYAQTARHWLENFDRNETEIMAVLKDVYGADAALWKRRWRWFYLATEGLFGHDGGREWGISHYRLRAKSG